ncbi:MAG: hypothetical protein JST22_13695 [Bacteroidetes bacterium]|nr:hypothetical protein [Bacteroidota bacterium]
MADWFGGGQHNDTLHGVAFGQDYCAYATGDDLDDASGVPRCVVAKMWTSYNTATWALIEGGPAACIGYSIATDGIDDHVTAVYVGGSNSSNAVFTGNQSGSPVVLASGGAFLARYDDGGLLIWARSFKCPSGATIRKVVVSNGQIFVAGDFKGTLILPANVQGIQPTIGLGSKRQSFVACLNANGETVWDGWGSPSVASTASDTVTTTGLAVMQDHCYVTGSYSGSVKFGSTSGGNSNPTPASSSSGMYVANYTVGGSGVDVWFQDGSGQYYPSGIVATASGIFLCGSYTGALVLQHPTSSETYTASGLDGFVCGLSSNPMAMNWFVGCGGSADDAATAIAFDGTSLHVAGWARDGTFGSTSTGITGSLSVSTGNEIDLFLANYKCDGTLLRVKPGAKGGDDQCLDVALDPDFLTYAVAGTCDPGAVFMNTVTGVGKQHFAARVPTQTDVDVLPDTGYVTRSGTNQFSIHAIIASLGLGSVQNVDVYITILLQDAVIGQYHLTAFPQPAGQFSTWPVSVDTVHIDLKDRFSLYTAIIRTQYPGDEDSRNDTLSLEFGPAGGVNVGGGGDKGVHDGGDRFSVGNGGRGNDGAVWAGGVDGMDIRFIPGSIITHGGGIEFTGIGNCCGEQPQEIATFRAQMTSGGLVLGADYSSIGSFRRRVELWNDGRSQGVAAEVDGSVDATVVGMQATDTARLEIDGTGRNGMIWRMNQPRAVYLPNGRQAAADEVRMAPIDLVQPPVRLTVCGMRVHDADSIQIIGERIRQFDVLHSAVSDALFQAHDSLLNVAFAPSARSKGLDAWLNCTQAFTIRMQPVLPGSSDGVLRGTMYGDVDTAALCSISITNSASALLLDALFADDSAASVSVQAVQGGVPSGSVIVLPAGRLGTFVRQDSVIACGGAVVAGVPEAFFRFAHRDTLAAANGDSAAGDEFRIRPLRWSGGGEYIGRLRLTASRLDSLVIIGEDRTVDSACRRTSTVPVTGERPALALEAVPNPSTDHFLANAWIVHACDVRVAVIDALGNEVAVPFSGYHQQGPLSIPIDAAGLPSGMYRLELRAAGQRTTAPLLIVR